MSIQALWSDWHRGTPYLLSYLANGDGILSPLTPLVGLAAYYQASPAAPVNGQPYALNVSASGELLVKVNAGSVGLSSGSNVGLVPTVSGGCSAYKNLDVNNAGYTVKASAGQVFRGQFCNQATAMRWLKFYNKTSPVVGSDAPFFTIGLPASSAGNLAFPEQGVAFSSAISVACTTGFADNNSGSPTANDVIVSLYYF